MSLMHDWVAILDEVARGEITEQVIQTACTLSSFEAALFKLLSSWCCFVFPSAAALPPTSSLPLQFSCLMYGMCTCRAICVT